MRVLWFGVGLLALVVAIAVLVGAVYGDAGLTVESVAAEGQTPTNTSANCEDVVVRKVTVSVTVSRSGASLDNPQLWATGLSVRASALGTTETRQLSLSPGERGTVSVPFTRIEDQAWAPLEHVDAVVRITHGNSVLAERTVTTTLQPVAEGESC